MGQPSRPAMAAPWGHSVEFMAGVGIGYEPKASDWGDL